MSRTKKIVLCISLTILIICSIIYNCINSDTYFTITSGNDLLAGNFSTISHVNNTPAIIQQWLYAIILALIDNNFGKLGLYVWVAIQNVVLIYISYKFIYTKTNNKTISIIGPLVSIILLNSYTCSSRPEVITIILLLLQVCILEMYRKFDNIKYLLLLIPLFIISANLHQAVFLYHFYIMIPFLIYNKKIDWKLVLSCPILFLTDFITPYGINGVTFLYKVYRTHVFNIVYIPEVSGFTFSNSTLFCTLCVIFMIISLIYITHIHFDAYFVFYGLTSVIVIFASFRHIILMYIALMYLFINVKHLKLPKIETEIFYVMIVFIMCLSFILTVRQDPDHDNRMALVSKLDSFYVSKDKTIYNTINLGPYLEYKGYNIVLDTRPELYTKRVSGLDYNPIEKYYVDIECCGLIYKDKIFEELDEFNTLVISKGTNIEKLLLNDSGNFICVYENEAGYIFLKKSIYYENGLCYNNVYMYE